MSLTVGLGKVLLNLHRPGYLVRKAFEKLVHDPWNRIKEARRLEGRARALRAGPRPGSAPYLSGDTFRAACDFSFGDDVDGPFPWDQMFSGCLVFCCSYRLGEFFEAVSARKVVPFVLLSGNGDTNITKALVESLPSPVLRWYAQNLAEPVGNRVFALPIGLENLHYFNHGVVADFDRLRKGLAAKRKKPRILYGFNVATNPKVRGPALEAAQRAPLADPLGRVDSRRYRRILRRYQFVLSPPGNGLDCHRTWEAMYLGVVPIVIRDPMSEAFRSLGLPMVLIDSWEDLKAFDSEALERLYQAESPRFPSPLLWHGPWMERIRQKENQR